MPLTISLKFYAYASEGKSLLAFLPKLPLPFPCQRW